jgi:hypothetical protein
MSSICHSIDISSPFCPANIPPPIGSDFMSLNLGTKVLAGVIAMAIGGADNAMAEFLVNANSVASATTNSAFLSGTGTVGALNGEAAFWGGPSSEGGLSANLFSPGVAPFDDSTAPGTALGFYQENVVTNGSVLTYDAASVGPSPVPLPTPLLLLLSGLGLMGVVARRGKPSADLPAGKAAAKRDP